MTVRKTRLTVDGPIVEVEDGRMVEVEDCPRLWESPPSEIPAAYRTCPLCKEVYAVAIAGLWRKIILDKDQVSVCAGCERRLTRLVEG